MHRKWYIQLFIMFVGSLLVHSNEPGGCRPTPDGRKLHIALYYECKCPYCEALVTDQLLPIYEDIKNQVELLFVPFGKAKSENNGEVFHCQHGPAECALNRMHSCVLDALNYDQDASVKFLGCQMMKNADVTGEECVRSVGVPYESILECQTGPKGIELQLKAENLTLEVASPQLKYVPFVVYNHVLNETEQKSSLRNWQKVICEQLAKIYCENALPPVCLTPPKRRLFNWNFNC